MLYYIIYIYIYIFIYYRYIRYIYKTPQQMFERVLDPPITKNA